MILKRFVLILLFAGLGGTVYAGTPDVIKVGDYAFPPFVTEADQDTSGIILDPIKVLNTYQKKYGIR